MSRDGAARKQDQSSADRQRLKDPGLPGKRGHSMDQKQDVLELEVKTEEEEGTTIG